MKPFRRELIMQFVVRIARIDKIQNLYPELFTKHTDGRDTWYTKN